MKRRNVLTTLTLSVTILTGMPFPGSVLAQPKEPSPHSPHRPVSGEPTIEAKTAKRPWTDFQVYDSGRGYKPAVACRGRYVVEVHSSGTSQLDYNGLYYRIGMMALVGNTQVPTVAWGPSIHLTDKYLWADYPSVAITPEGYVIITFTQNKELK